MFQRVVIEDWHRFVPVISFGITFAVFLIMVTRALLMKKTKADHMAGLPLEDAKDHSNRPH